jgi:creatinine amidohydrolase
MNSVQVEEMFPWQIVPAIAEAPIGYLPLGTLEWHGEHNVVGLDTLKAHAICVRAAQISGGVVLPPIYWATDERENLPDGSYLTGGVEHGERYHVPGNMFWLRPETYLNLLLDVYETMRRRGLCVIVVLAGHWSSGTMPTVRASGAEFTTHHPEVKWLCVSDLELGTDLGYLHEHAAAGETSLLMAIRHELVRKDLIFETGVSLKDNYTSIPEHLQRRMVTPHKYIGILTAAVDGSNDPEHASVDHGRFLLKTISARLAERACVLLTEYHQEKQK